MSNLALSNESVGDDAASSETNSERSDASSFSVSDYLLHALATGKARSGPQTRRRWLAAHVGLLLHRLDARLRRDGESVRDRITLVGFFIVMPFIGVAGTGLGAAYFAVGKHIAGIAAVIFVVFDILASLLIFTRTISPRVGSFFMLMLLMLLPVVNHVIQGGYAASGAVLCWSTITPALAGILLQSRFAVVLFTIIAVCAITFATMLAKVTAFVALDLRASEGLTGDLQTIFYFFDITLPNIALLLAVFFYDLRLSNEQHRTETLLNRIMPRKFASMLRRRKRAVVQYDNATCLFAEVVGFAELVESHSASDVIATIDILFEQMDAIAAKVGVLKVATIGHVYFAVAGVPVEVDPRESARKMANFALALRDLMSRDTEQYGIRLRMGIHSGPVVAGVIGNLSPQFTLIGDSVNVASRMESTSAAGRIHCSEATCRLLEPEFTLSRRAPISIKGKGMMQTYWLVGRLMSFEVASSPRRRSTLAHSRKGARGLRWRRRRSTQSTTASSGFEPAMEMESAETTSEEDEDDEEEEEEKE